MNSEGKAQAPVSIATGTGSLVENAYVRRTVKVLAVHDHEVDDISAMNTWSAACFSFASACIAFGGGILTNAAFADTLSPKASAAIYLATPLLLIFAAIFATGGFVAMRRRKNTLKQIREQSEVQ